MKYLITGGNGFLGKHLSQFFDSNNTDYIASVRGNPSKNQIATGDLALFTDWPALFQNIDVVVHTAAKTQEMSSNPELAANYIKENVELTKTLALAAKSNKVKRFIFISSLKVNGEFTLNEPFKADDAPNPSDAYGFSKQLAETELLKLHESGVFEVVIIRPCLIYGKGVKANFQNLVNMVKKQIPLPFGSVHNKRSFVSVENVCDLISCCATAPQAAGQIYLISDDGDLGLTEVIQLISHSLKIKSTLIPIPVTVMNLGFKVIGKGEFSRRLFSNLQVDIGKTKNQLNWKPPYTTSAGLEKMLS